MLANTVQNQAMPVSVPTYVDSHLCNIWVYVYIFLVLASNVCLNSSADFSVGTFYECLIA